VEKIGNKKVRRKIKEIGITIYRMNRNKEEEA